MNRIFALGAHSALLFAILTAPGAQAQVPDFLKRVLPGALGLPFPGMGLSPPGVMSPGMAWVQDVTAGHEHKQAARYAEAAAAYERALQSVDRVPQLASSALMILPSFGEVLVKLGRYDDAERALTRALSLDAEQAAVAGSNASFQSVMLAMRSIGQVGRDAAGQMNKSLIVDGPEGDPRPGTMQPPQPGVSIAWLAQVYGRRGAAGDTNKLLKLYQVDFPAWLAQVAKEKEKLGGPIDVDAETVSFQFAATLASAGLQDAANRAFEQALAANLRRLAWTSDNVTMLDFQAGGFQRRRLIAAAYAGHVLAGTRSDAETEAVVAALTSSKGLALRYANRRRTLLNTLQDSTVMAARDTTRALEQRLRRLPTTGEPAMRAWVDWSDNYDAALRPALPALARAGLSGFVTDGHATLQAARQQIGNDAIVGFHVYEPVDFRGLSLQRPRYLRYTLTRAALTLQDIGDKEAVDKLLWAWRGDVDRLGLPQAGAALAQALLGGMRPDVTTAQRWLVDPDGALTLLPFEALPQGQGVVLDTHRVSYTSSLAAFVEGVATAPPAPGATALVVADPRYAPAEQIAAAGNLGWEAGDRRLAGLQLKALPDTRAEAQAVAAAVQRLGAIPRVLLDADATPGAVRTAQAPRFLHVASHGLFLVPDVDAADRSRYRIALVVPGMLTGLALTPDQNGPMLWASDLAQMNLRGTSLVVLSACDTGNGLVDVGEGLTSLRRAAEEAGARATLTSLWPVSSRRTTELMTDFYQGLAGGESKSQALRAAKLKARARGGSVRDWSGFLLAGDDR